MKKNTDPRHKNRQKLVKRLFSYSFQPNSTLTPESMITDIVANLPQIDKQIAISAPEWPVPQINKLDLAVLRLAIHELSHTKTPPKVVIDEAVELGKEYGSNASAKFINGVLGNYLKLQNKQSESETTPNKKTTTEPQK